MSSDLFEGPMGETVASLPRECQRLIACAICIRDGKLGAEQLLEERELLPQETQDMLDALNSQADKVIDRLFKHSGELFLSHYDVDEDSSNEAVAVESAA